MQNKNDKTREQMDELLKNFTAVYIVILAIGFLNTARMFFPQRPRYTDLAVCAAGAVIGVILGRISQKRPAKTKLRLAAACLLLIAALTAGGKYKNSDSYLAKQEWPVHVMGKASFMYPSKFLKHDMKNASLENGTVEAYSNENSKRFASYFIYDFAASQIDAESLMTNNITSMMNSLHAKDAEVTKTDKDGRITRIQYTYTIKNNKLKGCAGMYVNGAHVELVTFYPVTKAFSETMLNKIYEGITVNKTTGENK